MKTATASLFVSSLLATGTALAGSAPYSPNAKPQTPPAEWYYVCTADNTVTGERYVSNVEIVPKALHLKVQEVIGKAWFEHLAKSAGEKNVRYPVCSETPSRKDAEGNRASEITSPYRPKVKQVDWKYGQTP